MAKVYSHGSQQRHVLSSIIIIIVPVIVTMCTITECTVTFIAEPRNMIVLEGNSVRFECDFEGSDLTPSWIINNSVYYHTSLPLIYSFNEQDFSLIIENVSLDLSGTSFECIVGRRKSAKGVLIVLRSQVNSSHPETPSEDFNATNFGLFLSTSTLHGTQSLVTTSFNEHQTKISTLWLVTLGIVMLAIIVLCLLLLIVVVSVRSYASYKKRTRANSVAITEMNDAYGVFNNEVAMKVNPAYEDLQLYRHD